MMAAMVLDSQPGAMHFFISQYRPTQRPTVSKSPASTQEREGELLLTEIIESKRMWCQVIILIFLPRVNKKSNEHKKQIFNYKKK